MKNWIAEGVSTDFSGFDIDTMYLPKHWIPWNPSSQVQVPVVSSQVPWFEQTPSTGIDGQSNSYESKNKTQLFQTQSINLKILNKNLLEQSTPFLPGSHKQTPVDVSQFPALLQFPGHNLSAKKYFCQNYGCKTVLD